ncbi:MAG: type II methionyl aminopeptidase [Candidatus Pacearchaeota archaeon]
MQDKSLEKSLEGYKKAGKIVEKALSLAKRLCKKDVLLLEIAEKIEAFVARQNASLAFPPNLSINEIAAHYSPFSNDKSLASGLLKVDIGVKCDDGIADAAISLDLDSNEENKALIKASQQALSAALKIARPDVEVCEIGKAIEKKISELGFKPIFNLSGHGISAKSLHSGKNIPNYNNGDKTLLKENEIIAIEPFVTLKEASGFVNDGRPSAIWILKDKKPRLYKEVYEFIKKNYSFLPFSQRWLEKSFANALLALKVFEKTGVAYNYKELVESSKAKVSQAETTIIIRKKPVMLVDIFEL